MKMNGSHGFKKKEGARKKGAHGFQFQRSLKLISLGLARAGPGGGGASCARCHLCARCRWRACASCANGARRRGGGRRGRVAPSEPTRHIHAAAAADLDEIVARGGRSDGDGGGAHVGAAGCLARHIARIVVATLTLEGRSPRRAAEASKHDRVVKREAARREDERAADRERCVAQRQRIDEARARRQRAVARAGAGCVHARVAGGGCQCRRGCPG